MSAYIKHLPYINGAIEVNLEYLLKILVVLSLLSKFLAENPLCACAQEISTLKKLLQEGETIKLSQVLTLQLHLLFYVIRTILYF